jgi:hypothetical protein
MLFPNTAPKWNLAWSTRRINDTYCESRVIIGPGFENKEAACFFQKSEEDMSFYTLGTSVIAVTDVVKIA